MKIKARFVSECPLCGCSIFREDRARKKDTEMVKVASVWVRQAEGRAEECTSGFFPTIAAANKDLARRARTMPNTGGYFKCDFVVTFGDGEQYVGRFDLTHAHASHASIAQQMVEHLLFVAGVRKPSHMTAEQYTAFIADVPATKREAAARYLGTYDLTC